MKKICVSLISFASFSILSPIFGQSLHLITNGRSDFRIVTPYSKILNSSDREAALFLQTYLKKISGVTLNIVTDNQPPQKNEILIGYTNREKKNNGNNIGLNGYTIKTTNNKLIILGKGEFGTTAAIVYILEHYLGCRKYSPADDDIPVRENVFLPFINHSYTPFNTYREVYYNEMYTKSYRAWFNLDCFDSPENKWGLWGMYSQIISPKEYFLTHPEYFAELNGKRIDSGQLCLSNDELFKTFVNNLKVYFAEKPNAKYWAIFPNDNDLYCRCPKCKKIDSAGNSPSASLLTFVNKIAKTFPEKKFVTLAYKYSLYPPKNIKPLPNVIIEICPINFYRERPLENIESLRRIIDLWKEKTNNLMIWDYVTDFTHLLCPFPNIHTLQKNIQYFNKNNIRMFFEEGNNHKGGEFSAFRAYLLSKLLWNPNLNYDSLQNIFLNGYYGNAGPYIKRYIQLMTKSIKETNAKLGLGDAPINHVNDYLSSPMLIQYGKLFDSAEKIVENEPLILNRVRIARLPLRFAFIEQLRESFAMKRSLPANYNISEVQDAVTSKDQTLVSYRENYNSLIDNFIKDCKAAGVENFQESSTSPDQYKALFKKNLKIY